MLLLQHVVSVHSVRSCSRGILYPQSASHPSSHLPSLPLSLDIEVPIARESSFIRAFGLGPRIICQEYRRCATAAPR